MKHQYFFLLGAVGVVFSLLSSSLSAEPRKNCEVVLHSLGYDLTSYVFEEEGWFSKEQHIFNGTLICFVTDDKEVHSIEDNGATIVEDGFFGQDALAKRDALREERRKHIEEEGRKAEERKRKIDEEFESVKQSIELEFDKKLQKVRLDSEPPQTAAEREARRREIEAARKAEEERKKLEEAEAEEAERRAEEAKRKAAARERQRRQSEIDEISRRTGSTVSLDITGESERACADLLAGHIENIDVHYVMSESMWGGKFTVWYRDHYRDYGPDQYNTRKCQVDGGTVRILSVFQDWD